LGATVGLAGSTVAEAELSGTFFLTKNTKDHSIVGIVVVQEVKGDIDFLNHNEAETGENTKGIDVHRIEERATREAGVSFVVEQKVTCRFKPFVGWAEVHVVNRESAFAEADTKRRFGARWEREDCTDCNKLGFVIRTRAIPLEAIGLLGFLDRFRRVQLERVVVGDEPMEFRSGSCAYEAHKVAVKILGWHLHRADGIHSVTAASKDDGAEVRVGGRERARDNGRLAPIDAKEL
jgi:hypothetical protein